MATEASLGAGTGVGGTAGQAAKETFVSSAGEEPGES